MSDYRLVIAHALTGGPFDEESVYDCVCTYVRAERDTGRSASEVSGALSELVEGAGAVPAEVRDELTRRVIPWCLEAYFGRRESLSSAWRDRGVAGTSPGVERTGPRPQA